MADNIIQSAIRAPAIHSAVVIDAETKQPLRIIVPDYEDEIYDPRMVLPGELIILIPKTDYKKMGHEAMIAHLDSIVVEHTP